MKKIFGFILIGLGIVTLIKGLPTAHGGAEAFGMLIGVSLFCFLPAYFLLRNKTKLHDADKE